MGGVSGKIGPGRGKQFDPDEKWSNLYREREKNNLYRWVGKKSGGDLMNIYERDGEEGISRFAEEKIAPMLFDDGLNGPHLIKAADYAKWRKAQNLELGLTEDEMESFESKFRDHNAQWRLNKRGVEGETLIHLLLSREQETCHEIARILIRKWPGLGNDIYLGNDMFGQAPLHLSIVHDDYETVVLLLQSGADVNAKAGGDFFMPEQFTDGISEEDIVDYSGFAYYGEFPLAFAACFGNKDIYDLLIEYGADPNLQDFFGNTILHMCVISDNSSMYAYAVKHWKNAADPDLVNKAGYTPLTLATKLGRKDIFEQMLELSKQEFWRFSDMACSAFPLNALDSIRQDGSTNYDSALMTVINGTTSEHLDMVGSEVIDRLLQDKWHAFAKNRLMIRMLLLGVQLLSITIAAGVRPTELDRLFFNVKYYPFGNYTDKNKDQETGKTYVPGARYDDWIRMPMEVITYLSTLYYFWSQIGEVRAQGILSFFRNMLTTPAKVIYTFANMMILVCLPCRLLMAYEYEECLLVVAIPSTFIYMLFFARSFKLTGPFVQMIYSMIAGDLMLFVIISAIFVLPFSFVFNFLGSAMRERQRLGENYPEGSAVRQAKGFKNANCAINSYPIFTFQSWFETFVTLFRASMGGYDYEEFNCSNYEQFTKVLFVVYMFTMPIMMINILIAMMGNTYQSIIVKAEKAWRRQYAQIIMNLERSLNQQELIRHMYNYSIKLQDATDGDEEVRGLMVIKKTHKTRASARRNAIVNWRSIGKKVIHKVTRIGVEQAKQLLHGHDRVEPLEDEKFEVRPMTRSYHWPSLVQKTGNAEIVRLGFDDESPRAAPTPQGSAQSDGDQFRLRVGPRTAFGQRPYTRPTTTNQGAGVAPLDLPVPSSSQNAGVTLDPARLPTVLGPPRPLRLRMHTVFPITNLPNMPSSTPPTIKSHSQSAGLKRKTAETIRDVPDS